MYSRILYILERIVKHPVYHLGGIASDHLVYISTQEGTTDLWSLSLSDGTNIKLAEKVIGVSHPRHKDNIVLYALDVSKGKELHEIYINDIAGGKQERALEMKPMRLFGITHIGDLISFSGASMTENAVYLGKIHDKAEKIYSSKNWVFTSDMNKDYIIGAGTLLGDPRSMEIFIYSIKDNEFRVYTPREGSFNMPTMIYKDKIIFTSNYEGKKQLYIYDISMNNIEKPMLEGREHLKFEFNDYQSYGFTMDGKIWFIGLSEYRGYAFLDGYMIYHPEGTPTNLEVYKNDIYITFSNLKTPYSIYKTGFDKGEWKRIVGKDLEEDILERLGDIEITKYKSFDGLQIPTIIYKTKNGTPGPTVLYVHGGPWSHVGDFWSIFIPSLVASGFHVIAPNFRGSTGYGEEFRRLDIGDPGGGDLEDIVHARDYAYKIGLANKIAIMGYSYGGFMTYLATAKKPGIWDAGVAGAGIVDWEMMYELADAAFKHFQEILFAGNMELQRDRSAINFIENLDTPLCILHPQNDTRTPLKPVLRYMEKLIEKGKVFEAHIFPDMGHMITNIDDALKLIYPAIIFLKKTLEGR